MSSSTDSPYAPEAKLVQYELQTLSNLIILIVKISVLFLPDCSVWQSECAHLVKVVVFLRFEQVEGLPLLFTGTGQQVVEHMVVPVKHTKHRVRGSDCEEPETCPVQIC